MTLDRQKVVAKRAIQRTLGLHGYLVAHSLFVSATLRFRHENGDVRAFLARLRPDSTVLDVGANVGALTAAFARRCPKGMVHAFEPIPANLLAAETVLGLRHVENARLWPVAVGDESRMLEMILPMQDGVVLDGLSHVRDERMASGSVYTVPCIRLDDFAPFFGPVDAIKLDVENYEQNVIRGARELIARDRPLIYAEIWSDCNMAGCLEVLTPLGYHVEIADGERTVPYNFQRGLEPLNFFFVP